MTEKITEATIEEIKRLAGALVGAVGFDDDPRVLEFRKATDPQTVLALIEWGEAWKAEADAWFRVHEASVEFLVEADAEDEEYNAAELDRLGRAHHSAAELAHGLGNRRCPECRGNGGFLDGRTLGFVPCPECDGNPWEEVVQEMEHEETQALDRARAMEREGGE